MMMMMMMIMMKMMMMMNIIRTINKIHLQIVMVSLFVAKKKRRTTILLKREISHLTI